MRVCVIVLSTLAFEPKTWITHVAMWPVARPENEGHMYIRIWILCIFGRRSYTAHCHGNQFNVPADCG